MLYIFSVLDHGVITKSDNQEEEFRKLKDDKFTGVPIVTLSPLACVNADSISSVCEPMV